MKNLYIQLISIVFRLGFISIWQLLQLLNQASQKNQNQIGMDFTFFKVKIVFCYDKIYITLNISSQLF